MCRYCIGKCAKCYIIMCYNDKENVVIVIVINENPESLENNDIH